MKLRAQSFREQNRTSSSFRRMLGCESRIQVPIDFRKDEHSRFTPSLRFCVAEGVNGPALSSRTPLAGSQGRVHLRAFTMIEIAISLAVIGFALVAIIGILPAGMNVQKENRQETIITQDASVFINAIRNGERGIDDLTNYVVAISNFAGIFNADGSITPISPPLGYTFTNSYPTGYPITNGLRIVGLLSTPRYEGNRSNYLVAYVRSVSGLASEKYPQTSRDAQEFALQYRLLLEVLPMHTNHFDASWTNFTDTAITADTNLVSIRSNYWRLVRNYQSNYHDLRLTFRWPYQAGRTGNGRQVFRTSVTGSLFVTNEPGFGLPEHRLFFFEPRNYVQVKP